ncbi:methyltransferase [Hallerella succinigenes]|uniref:Ubiquinone/menaquinone biosynthesis C-methylase UbiE n=1 Tax=Hallerella succinigenes TaxID=1896222 RepID=A0A2M9A5R4_9BACT|nr:class I SAM-dependent methyltransferase [Hallerella succinigenes]PJJ41056.1 ubiquinone/menaquinone biosynthesis C-methylase UbiE [Hallerella succinigenes]
MFESYYQDDIDAVNAKFEAQKIAFAPLSFQAARALRDFGILELVSKSRRKGITVKEISEKTGLSEYGVGVLMEMGLGMGMLKLKKDSPEDNLLYTLSKVGFFVMTDDMTRVNMDFSEDVCYAGADDLAESIKNGKPEGLKHFGKWTTVYEGLSQCSDQFKKSWFGFDHFYSDLAFPEALPIVYSKPVKRLFDIGGNTAKWAIQCCKYNPDVQVSIIDLPGQTAVAEKNAKAAGFENRISTIPCNVLDSTTEFPKGADAIWMSQFLDCFSLHQITKILKKIHPAASSETDIYVLEPIWDKQRFEAAAYSLQATSLYFTCIANGNSKMYRFNELKNAIEDGGFELKEAHHNLGINCYTLFRFRKK